MIPCSGRFWHPAGVRLVWSACRRSPQVPTSGYCLATLRVAGGSTFEELEEGGIEQVGGGGFGGGEVGFELVAPTHEFLDFGDDALLLRN